MIRPKCWYCEREDDLQQQIGGFWFCFRCLPRAEEKGASFWVRLYSALYPWR